MNKTIHLIKKAFEGDIESQYLLGCQFLTSKIIESDIDETIEWWTKSANSGHIISMYHLGVLYKENRKMDPEFKSSQFWLKKASDFGCNSAEILLEQIDQEILKDRIKIN